MASEAVEDAVGRRQSSATAASQAPVRSRYWQRLYRQGLPFVGLLMVAGFILVAVFAQALAPQAPESQDLAARLQGPSASHWLGTDQLGRDTLSRLVVGAQVTGLSMLEAIAVAVGFGVPVGVVAGYIDGVFGWFSARVNDVLLTLPTILVVFGIVAAVGPSQLHAMLALGMVFSTRYIMLGRALVGSARKELYVASAEVIGLPRPIILVRHVLPNIVRPIIVQTSILLGAIVMVAAELSYLGLTAQAGSPAWGRTLSDSQPFVWQAPLVAIIPGLAIGVLALSLNLAGDCLADGLISATVTAPAGASTKWRKRRRQVVGHEARDAMPTGVGALSAPPVDVGATVDMAISSAEPHEMAEAVLRIEQLSVAFPGGDGSSYDVTSNVTLALRPGQTLGLVGESGCGKSMTMLASMGLVPTPGFVRTGSVDLCGTDIVGMSEAQLQRFRRDKIGVVFQDAMSALNPSMPIGAQVAEPLRASAHKISRSDMRKQVIELLELVGVPDARNRLGQYPHELSGGIAQRVCIARAVATRPKVLIADEPTTALDVTVQGRVLGLLAQLRDRFGMAIILVTHNLAVAADLCDQIAVMYAGQVVEQGSCAEVLLSPQHPYTKGLVASLPTTEIAQTHLTAIPGRVPPAWLWDDGCRFRDRCPFVRPVCATSHAVLDPSDHQVRCARVAEVGHMPFDAEVV